MFTEINEPIEVAANFTQNQLLPFKFVWNGRDVIIKKINLAYSSWEGKVKIYYFAVSDDANYFKLRFDTGSLGWTLLESYMD